jgi:hypothetical protein
MSITEDYKQLAQSLIGNTPTTIYTVPPNTQAIIKHIVITNPSGTDYWVKMWSTGSSDVNLILGQVTLDANGGRAEFDGSITLDAADTLIVEAEIGATLAVTVHGMQLES